MHGLCKGLTHRNESGSSIENFDTRICTVLGQGASLNAEIDLDVAPEEQLRLAQLASQPGLRGLSGIAIHSGKVTYH